MKPELKEFILGLIVIFAIGTMLSMVITPTSFGGWFVTVVGTLVVFAIVKSVLSA